MRRGVIIAGVLALLLLVAAAPERRTTVDAVSREVVCPSCGTTLDRSSSPAAERMRAFITTRVEAGQTKQQILDALVEQYGGDERILARPPAHGSGLVSWGGPFALAAVLVGFGVFSVRRWARRGKAAGTDQPIFSDNP